MTERKHGRIALAGGSAAGGAAAPAQLRRADSTLPGIGREVLRILVLEDRDADAELIERALRRAGFAYMFERARDEAAFLAKLDLSPHVIVADYYVPGCDALHALKLVRSRGLDVPFILVSGVIGETRALEAMRLGATDFLLKDRLGRLGSAIKTALELAALRRKANGAHPKPEQGEIDTRDGRLARADRARKVMAECSRALVHAADERQFLQEMCRIVVDSGGYVQSYIGLAQDDEERSVTPVASAGFEDGYLEQARRSWRSKPRRPSVMGDVIATGERFITRDIFADPALKRWVARARSRGYQALICLPLRIEERCIGGFSIYAREPDAFNHAEIELLEMLAGDISYGIASLRARAAARESEEHFRATFDQAAVGVAHTTIEGRFLRANNKLCEILGYAPAELLALTTRDLLHPDDRDRRQAQRQELLDGKRSSYSAERRYVRKDGSAIWINRTVTLARPAGGEPYLIQVMEDITERKTTEAQLERLRRARQVMAACNRILVHVTDETRMLQEMCRVAVESGGYKQAWVGLITGDRKRPVYVAAHAGYGSGPLPMTSASVFTSDGSYRGKMATVVATGEPSIERDVPSDSRWSSSLTLPLKSEERILGGFEFNASEADAFDKDEIVLLTELVADIAFGISALRERLAREHAERAARENERRLKESFEQAAVGISRVGLDGVLMEVNQKFCDMLGYAKIELIGKSVKDITHPHDYGQGAQHRSELTHRTALSAAGEKRFIRKDGSVMWARRTMSAALDDAGKPQYVISVIEDITERKEIELRFERVFDQAAVGMAQLDLEGRFMLINERFADMLGYSREELIGLRPEDVTHPEDREEVSDVRQRLMQGAASISSEKRYVRKNGSVIWVNRTASLARNEAGDPLYYIGIVEDITERKEIQHRFEQTFNHAAVGMVLTALDGRYLQANQRFADMLGYRREELVGASLRSVAHTDDAPDLLGMRRKLLSGEIGSVTGERRYLHKDGHVVWVNRTLSLARTAGGDPLYFISVVDDVTETKQREAHYRAMFENAAVGITRVDLSGNLVDVNQKFCDMLGYAREELKGKAIRDITHPDDFDQGSQFRAQLAQGEAKSASGEKRFVRKDGAIIWARRTMSTVVDETGTAQYVISVVEDITERKAAEEALRLSEETFRVTFDQASVGIIVTDLDHRFLQVNERYCEIVGYSREELMRMTVFDVNLPENVPDALDFRRRLIAGTAEPRPLEKQLKRRDFSLVWVTLVTSLVRGKNGEPMHFISCIQDISESKHAQERYRTTFDNAPVGIMHTSIDTDRIVHANARLCEMLGYSHDELVSMRTDEFINPAFVGADQPRYRGRMLKGELDTFSSERLYRRKDGSDLWVNRTVSLARDTAGRPLYFIRVIEDIGERKRAEEAVARERALLRTIIDTVPDYIYVKDAEGRFQLANKAWLKERNRKDEEIAGKTVFDVFSADLARRMAAQDAAVIETGVPMLEREQQIVLKTPDGQPARTSWTAITKVPMRDAAGNIIGTVGISRDITEQKLSARRREMEHAVTRVLSEAGTLDEAMRRILQTICEGLDWACGSYWQWDEGSELLRCVESWHIDAPGVAEFAAASRDGTNEAPAWRNGSPPRAKTGGLVRSVWQSGAPVWFPDVTQRTDFRRGPAAARANLHCAFGFPVLAGGQPLGLMEFYSRDIKEPDKALLQIVRAIGSQIGQFIQRKEAEQALRLNEERYRDQFEASPLPMWVWDDEKLNFLAVNQAAVDHYGYTREEFLRMSVRDIWAPHEEKRYDENIRDRVGERTLNLQRRHRTRDGSIIDVEVTARRFMRDGRDVWLTLVNDVSERLRAERALQESEEQFRQLANNIPQVFWITDLRQKDTLYLSPAAQALIGHPVEEIRSNPRILVRSIHPEDRVRVYAARKTATAGGYDETYRIVRPDGTIRWVHDRAFPVPDAAGNVYRIAGIAEDITERKLAEERLMHLAHYDVLTSLPNRVLFYDRLKLALAHAKRNQWTVGVMLIDVDRFKNVNDTLGHAVGDRLLQQVSERLTRSVRAGDTVGRLGGDEFAVVLSNLATAQDANLVAQKIMASFKDPFRLEEGGEIYVTGSIGITLYPDDSTDQDALIKNADAAMYRAKEVGRNAYRFYTPEMNARALEMLSMESSLRRALDRREFLLYYQPKVSVTTGEIVGVEALLRWRHPERGLVSPGEFMPVLEETGLIVSVGEWVVRAVCAQISVWQSAGIDPKAVAINLSARQFVDKDLGNTIKRILEENSIDPKLIEFEITESSLMANTEESIRTLEFLAQLGVGLSIDDFGTGYSSLGYLKRFPLDALKIDRSFVRDITTSADDATITRAVISMAHSLGLKVIAEGVETEQQISFLAEHGCDEFQGFYFSRPLPSDECGIWLKEKRASLRPAQSARPGAAIVLLVDDDNDSLTLFKRALASDSYRILTAHSAREGLELLAKHRVDVVISDQNMPGIPGIEFLRRVRRLFPGTLRVMTSAHPDPRDGPDAAETGDLFHFLPKHLSDEELRAGVREALQRKSS